ncbi:hypothetical protein ROZALSC1DRAFT_24518 [Rozella allomycis CSF55]|uniref:Uncharacterized protein n=1 Tax=Rozella allomycis (strain CSF55) TaxID=988480 RepID=A0A4P9YD67_ROZAC|nr:hypothetical protein ROZALSC1DRAFT_24518 [Rozella allomycis CSF55]
MHIQNDVTCDILAQPSIPQSYFLITPTSFARANRDNNLVRIKAHIGLKWNENADALAKYAYTTRKQRRLYHYNRKDSYKLTYIHHNNHRYEFKPQKVIGLLYNSNYSHTIYAALSKHFNTAPYTIELKLTLTLIQPTKHNIYFLSTTETAFRTPTHYHKTEYEEYQGLALDVTTHPKQPNILSNAFLTFSASMICSSQ